MKAKRVVNNIYGYPISDKIDDECFEFTCMSLECHKAAKYDRKCVFVIVLINNTVQLVYGILRMSIGCKFSFRFLKMQNSRPSSSSKQQCKTIIQNKTD